VPEARGGSAPPRVGVVSLTQGRRPAELAAGLASLAAQTGVRLDVVVVGNGWAPTGLPDGIRGIHLPADVGIPAGRNAGAAEVSGEWIFFLDDDAAVPSPTFLVDAIAVMHRDRRIGLLQPRVVDPTGAASPRRWVPRIRKGDPADSGPVFSVWEGATLLPRSVFDAVGGWGDPYRYAHEGVELAWRVWDAGRRAWYAGDLVAHHPAISPTRHADYHRLNARNRVWVARRNLPAPLVPVYVLAWTGVQVLRWLPRQPRALAAWFGGWSEGWRVDPGGRRPLRWRTVWRMTRAGRPPIV